MPLVVNAFRVLEEECDIKFKELWNVFQQDGTTFNSIRVNFNFHPFLCPYTAQFSLKLLSLRFQLFLVFWGANDFIGVCTFGLFVSSKMYKQH
jgi:hypothetical protein